MTTTRDSQVRFQQRQRHRRLVAVRPVLIAIGTLAVATFLGWVVFFSPWLTVDTVKVTGLTTLRQQQVLSAARVPIGTPLMRVDLSAIERRVEAVPAVDSASVHRSWPHSVTIAVTERQPLAAIDDGGAWWVMDHEGVLFRRTPRPVGHVPVVRLGPRADAAARQEVASVISALPAPVLADVRRLTAKTMDSITLDLAGGTKVIWGSAAESARKVQVLGVLLKDVTASTYDVSVPEQPTTRG
jgi:cell division protein FtsQ